MIKILFKYSVLALCFFTLLNGCKKDDLSSYNQTIIWRGFHHVWEYNHRVNRMGDWIGDINQTNGYSANAYHTAASGIGPDKNEYKTYLTSIKTSNNIIFNNIEEEFIFQGIEGSIDSQTVQIALEIPSTSHNNTTVVLNGFDMYARPIGSDNLVGDGDADKLTNFSIDISNVLSQPNGNAITVTFTVNATFGADCTSPECSNGASNDWFDYLVTMHFQVISANDSYLNETTKLINQSYEWEKPNYNQSNEIFEENYVIKDININGLQHSKIGFVALKGFSFETTKGFGGFNGNSFEYPHMQTFNLALKPLNYNADEGSITLDADMFYKNWAKPVPIFSFGGGGTVKMESEVAFIQINDNKASIEHFQLQDDITWLTNPFDPSPPNIEASINYLPISAF